MEATRLAPAGRACSKFVWQSRFLTTGRFECLRIRAAPSFLPTFTNAAHGPKFLAFFWGCDLVRPNAPVPSELPTQINQARFLRRGVATLLPRLGVTPRGGNAADGGV
jgi:hypothetical protein